MADFAELAGLGLGEIAGLTTEILILVIIVMIWKLVWYGLALYKTIERKQIIWFTVLFVAAFLLGDLGLLAIIYLLIYKPRKPKAKSVKKRKK